MTERRATASGRPPEREDGSTPTAEKLSDGQYRDHWVLSEEDRAKGFIGPCRKTYVHVGAQGPRYTLTEITEDERGGLPDRSWKFYEAYPDSELPKRGKYWTDDELKRVGAGCGSVTSMPLPIAETYAVNPHFYGSTYCAACQAYFPVGEQGEFVWEGTNQRVGTVRKHD